MPSIEHLSYSSVSSYLLCGHSWKLHYLDKVSTPTATALVFGSAVHGALENHLRSGEPLDAAWSRAWGQQLERNAKIDWGADTPEGMQADGARILGAKKVQVGIAEIAANYDRDQGILEKRVELSVPGVSVPIIGYIDVITRDGIPGDFKTAARMWSDSKADDDLQSLFYLAALNQEGIKVPDWAFRHYVISKTANPDMRTFEVQHSPAQIVWLFEVIQRVWQAIEAGVFPMVPGGWKCGPKYCDYWSLCRGRYS